MGTVLNIACSVLDDCQNHFRARVDYFEKSKITAKRMTHRSFVRTAMQRAVYAFLQLRLFEDSFVFLPSFSFCPKYRTKGNESHRDEEIALSRGETGRDSHAFSLRNYTMRLFRSFPFPFGVTSTTFSTPYFHNLSLCERYRQKSHDRAAFLPIMTKPRGLCLQTTNAGSYVRSATRKFPLV